MLLPFLCSFLGRSESWGKSMNVSQVPQWGVYDGCGSPCQEAVLLMLRSLPCLGSSDCRTTRRGGAAAPTRLGELSWEQRSLEFGLHWLAGRPRLQQPRVRGGREALCGRNRGVGWGGGQRSTNSNNEQKSIISFGQDVVSRRLRLVGTRRGRVSGKEHQARRGRSRCRHGSRGSHGSDIDFASALCELSS